MQNNVYIFRNKIDLSFVKIFPGDWVVIKPNLIKESIRDIDLEWESTITSTKIIKLVCEYVCKKLKGKGKITICDAPQTDSSFKKIVKSLIFLILQSNVVKSMGLLLKLLI